MKTILIVGASGVVGEAALMHFTQLEGWHCIALSRRKPNLATLRPFTHLTLDLSDANACMAIAPQLREVTHILYAAVAEKPGLVSGWQDQEQIQLNLAMLRHLLEPMVQQGKQLQHVSLLQGAKAYGAHVGHQPPIPARECDAHRQHDNFYWLQEDYLRQLATEQGFHWTIFRPQVIIGAAPGAAMNPLLPLAAFAAIRREEGKPFSFPGGELQIAELVDANLLAKAFCWAAEAETAQNEVFNFTNGDVFCWRSAWPTIAKVLDIETGPDEPLSLSTYLMERSALWEEITAREGLQPFSLADFLGQSHHYLDILLRRNATTISPPTLLSTVKIRQAGFTDCCDSYQAIHDWITELQVRHLIPQPR